MLNFTARLMKNNSHVATQLPIYADYKKGSQALDCFDFFCPKSEPYMTLVNIREKFRFFFRFLPEF